MSDFNEFLADGKWMEEWKLTAKWRKMHLRCKKGLKMRKEPFFSLVKPKKSSDLRSTNQHRLGGRSTAALKTRELL